METRDEGGYVFRTDLRLRPDPAATPPVVAVPAAISYYESMGQNWERAAMVKARPVAGDFGVGAAFLSEIRPFIWRRHLDFAAIADIHAMKQRIDAHRRRTLGGGAHAPLGIGGYNVKLGGGGIREIEFVTQTLQLVWGGRDPAFRCPTTLGALRSLARHGQLPPEAEADLAAAYEFLRSLEHRLQMVDDRQIHVLPERLGELERFASFAGFADAGHLADTLIGHLERVEAHYQGLFTATSRAATAAGPSVTVEAVAERGQAVMEWLARLGFTDGAKIATTLAGWRQGRLRALRSERARQLLDHILADAMTALARQPQPDIAFARFDALLSRLPAGVQFLSLFERNPALLERIATILGAAPQLADHLARHPAALDGLLSPQGTREFGALLDARLKDARLLEDAIGIVRRTVQEEQFSIAVATMAGRMDADCAGRARAALADAAIGALLPRLLEDFSDRNGSVPGGAMAVVALGKAGGREMMAGSDLDLMLVYDHPDGVSESVGASGGRRAMAASQWFLRACHAFVAALTAPSADGALYAVDMRLRPSGNKGPVAVSLKSFRHYHRENAWTWERMALTRARVVAGPADFQTRVRAAIEEALDARHDATIVRNDAAAMRARLGRELPPDGPWDVKHRSGGQVEVEFIAQALQLVHGRLHPELRATTTSVALRRLGEAGFIPVADAKVLIRADHLWRTIQGMLRITLGRAVPEPLPEASARTLLRAVEADVGRVDLAGLRATMESVAGDVRRAFVRHVGELPE
jgi:glutamate-ammonia-ligase adenylyltransferase